MSPDEYLDAIEREADALADAAAASEPDAPVPSCPRWTVADLLEHVGRVHRWAAANASRPPDAEPWWSRDVDVGLPDDHGERVEWVREGARELRRALERPPDTPAWTFVPPATVGFWQRRQAHETAVHRWDAQLVTGLPAPIDAAFAVDGTDEVLGMIPVRPGAAQPPGNGVSIHLQCTDGDGQWIVWGRVRLDAVDVVSDREVLARFQDSVRI